MIRLNFSSAALRRVARGGTPSVCPARQRDIFLNIVITETPPSPHSSSCLHTTQSDCRSSSAAGWRLALGDSSAQKGQTRLLEATYLIAHGTDLHGFEGHSDFVPRKRRGEGDPRGALLLLLFRAPIFSSIKSREGTCRPGGGSGGSHGGSHGGSTAFCFLVHTPASALRQRGCPPSDRQGHNSIISVCVSIFFPQLFSCHFGRQ